ncbi:hypothetical protein LSPH24S_08037 [Lysinibacillus sphaericus]
MEFLKLDHIHHSYFSSTQAKEVLKDINLDIREGEFVSFMAKWLWKNDTLVYYCWVISCNGRQGFY